MLAFAGPPMTPPPGASLYEARGANGAPIVFSAPWYWPHSAVRAWASAALLGGGRVWSLQRVA